MPAHHRPIPGLRRRFSSLLALVLLSLSIQARASTRPVPRITLISRTPLAGPVEAGGAEMLVMGSLVAKPDLSLPISPSGAGTGSATATLRLEASVLVSEGNPWGVEPGTSLEGLAVSAAGVRREDGKVFEARLGWIVGHGAPHYDATLVLDSPGIYDFSLEAAPDPIATTRRGPAPPVLSAGFTVDFAIPPQVLEAARRAEAARAAPAALASEPVAEDMTLLVNWDTRASYSAGCGYQDASGKYALIGATDGTQIVEVTDPANPHEWGFIPGNSSTWRECKSYGVRAYVTTEASGSGMQIINLSNPHAPYLESTYTATFQTAHTLFINTSTGVLYVNGTGGTGSGMQIFDLTIDPVNLVQVGNFTTRYVHDSYEAFDPRSGTYRAYLSEINNGLEEIYDDTNKSNFILINSWTTPGAFTHNSTVNADHTIVMTTDENNPAGSATVYDITDPTNEVQLSTYRSGGSDTVIHNVHFDDGDPELIWASHYTQGVRLVDLHRPTAPTEIGHYDTFPASSGGEDGCWEVWPYDRDGWAYLFDREGGLYVVRHDPTGGLLSGVVRDSVGSQAIAGAHVLVLETGQLAMTNSLGVYALKVGAGAQTVRASAYGHLPSLVPVTMAAGVRNDKDISLVPVPQGAVSGFVRRSDTNQGLGGVAVSAVGSTLSTTTASDGSYTLVSVSEGTQQLDTIKFGFSRSRSRVTVSAGATATLNVLLDPATFSDDSETDKGWTFFTTGDTNSTSSRWVRVDPNGTSSGSTPVQPEDDHTSAPGVTCFVTGNCPAGSGTEACDVDNGVTTLTSPTFSAAAVPAATIEYWRWFSDDTGVLLGGALASQVSNNNGTSWIDLETVPSTQIPWTQKLTDLGSVIPLSSTMRVRFRASSGSNSAFNVTEAAVDDVQVLKACQSAFNPTAPDSDGDGIVNACDSCPSDPLNDVDGDGVCGNTDKSPFVSDPSQADADADGVGDAADNCRTTANADQADNDADGTGNICDSDDDNDGTPDATDPDDDNDGVPDASDNCPSARNPQQEDHGSDGTGDACDPDDGLVTGVRFRGLTALVWDKETGSASYNVYRGDLGHRALVPLASCFADGLVTAFTSDLDLPMRGEGFFYLVTRKDGAGVESSPGYASDGIERTINNHCP